MPAFMVDAAAAAERAFPGTTASSFGHLGDGNVHFHVRAPKGRSEEHTSELQSLMRISYAVFCLKKKTKPHEVREVVQLCREQQGITRNLYKRQQQTTQNRTKSDDH